MFCWEILGPGIYMAVTLPSGFYLPHYRNCSGLVWQHTGELHNIRQVVLIICLMLLQFFILLYKLLLIDIKLDV